MHKPSRVTVFIFLGSQFTVIHSLCTLENSDVNTSFITGAQKSTVWLFKTSTWKFFYWTSNISFSLAQWAEGL